MIVITLARKPLAGTVAATAEKYGAGGINIDECRVGTNGATSRGGQAPYPKNPDGTEDRSGSWARTGHEILHVQAGRWPANLILEHKPGCQCVGTKKIKNRSTIGSAGTSMNEHGYVYKFGSVLHKHGPIHHDENGLETIPAWECEPGCPVAEMDIQSGSVPTQANRSDPKSKLKGRNEYFGLNGRTERSPEYLGEQGGASRFFKQVQGDLE